MEDKKNKEKVDLFQINDKIILRLWSDSNHEDLKVIWLRKIVQSIHQARYMSYDGWCREAWKSLEYQSRPV